MSRIYDALKQTENEVVRMIEGEQAAQAGAELLAPPGPPPPPAPPPVAEPDVAELVFPAPDGNGGSGYRTARIRTREKLPVLPFDGSDRRTAERYRILRTNILQHPARPRVIAVTSAGPGDGKTTNAINLAGVLALKQDLSVVLVDGDLRHGSVASLLGLEPFPGLAEVLTGQCPLSEAIVQTEDWPGLHILPAGRIQVNPAELLDSAAWKQAMLDLRERFQYVIVDATPIGIVADYDLIQVAADGAIVVVRPDHSDRQACLGAFDRVAKGKLLGALLNCAQEWFLWPSHDHYGYYEQGKQPPEKS